jgi:hypothetical protein
MRPALISVVFDRTVGRSSLLGLVLVLTGMFATHVPAAPAGDLGVFVSPDRGLGQDDPARGTTSGDPFLTIGYALDLTSSSVQRAVIWLLPGTYGSAAEGSGSETFPIVVPAMEAVEFAPLQGEGTVDLSSADPLLPLLQFVPSTAAASVTLRGLSFTGGLVAACFPSVQSRNIVIEIESCSALNQAGTAIEIFGEPDANVALNVRDCVLHGAKGGVAVENARSGRLDLRVEGSLFSTIGTYSPGGFLGAGVDVHLDSLGTVVAVIRGNIFRGAASAVQFTTSPAHPHLIPSAGALTVEVSNNLVDGFPLNAGSQVPLVKNGIYLSVWPHHTLNMSFLNNTFVGISDYVVYQDNAADLEETGSVVPLIFANNICFGVGAESEFSVEIASQAPFPPLDMLVVQNRLEQSALADTDAGGNFNGDPLFVDVGQLDFRLASNSPAVDTGNANFSPDGDTDLGGLCRRASTACGAPGSYLIDVGAHERAGLCAAEDVVFIRGDCNRGTGVDLSDAIFTLNYLFLGGALATCVDACDANDDGGVNISDPISTLMHLFRGGDALPAPYPEAGLDETPDCLPSCR